MNHSVVVMICRMRVNSSSHGGEGCSVQETSKTLCPGPIYGTIRNTGAPEYEIRWLEGYEFADLTGYRDEVKEGSSLPNMKRVNQAIMIVVEDCGKEKFLRAGNQGKEYYLIKAGLTYQARTMRDIR